MEKRIKLICSGSHMLDADPEKTRKWGVTTLNVTDLMAAIAACDITAHLL